METFEIGCFNKVKKFIQSCSCSSWLTCNSNSVSARQKTKSSWSTFKIFFTSILFPIGTVIFDMFYSDTMVIVKLVTYTVSIFNNTSNSSDTSSYNNIDSDMTTGGATVILMMIPLSAIFSISFFKFAYTPYFTYLMTSFKTSQSLLEETTDMSTPLGWILIESRIISVLRYFRVLHEVQFIY